MGVPKRKRSKSRQRKTRMHIYLEEPVLNRCPRCGKPVLPHTVCQNCGYYKGREVINVLEKLEKKERKIREKEIKAKKKEEKVAKKKRPLDLKELSRK